MKWRSLCVALCFALMLTGMWGSVALAQSIMVEKNLFSPDRRPPSDEPVGNASAKDLSGLPAKSIQLDGIFIHQGQKTALLRVRRQLLGAAAGKDRNPFPYLTVHEGGTVGDFQVLKIDPSSVTIARNGQQFVISLFAEGKVVPPAAPLPALPAAAGPNKGAKQPQKTQMGQGKPRAGTAAGAQGRVKGNLTPTRNSLKGTRGGTPPDSALIPPGVNSRQAGNFPAQIRQ